MEIVIFDSGVLSEWCDISGAGHQGAGIAQLVERKLPKLDVAGSSPVSRSIKCDVYRAVNGHLTFVSEWPFLLLPMRR